MSYLASSVGLTAKDTARPHVLILLPYHWASWGLVAVPVLSTTVYDATLLTLQDIPAHVQYMWIISFTQKHRLLYLLQSSQELLWLNLKIFLWENFLEVYCLYSVNRTLVTCNNTDMATRKRIPTQINSHYKSTKKWKTDMRIKVTQNFQRKKQFIQVLQLNWH